MPSQNDYFKDFLEKKNDKNTNWLVKYSAEWCGHCVGMQNEWDKLYNNNAKNLANKGVKIVTVDHSVMEKVEEKLGNQNVQGFPTIRMIKGNQETIDYSGERNADSLKKFAMKYINKKQKDNKQKRRQNQDNNKDNNQKRPNRQRKHTQGRKRQAGGRTLRKRMSHRNKFLKISK